MRGYDLRTGEQLWRAAAGGRAATRPDDTIHSSGRGRS
ncbi:hypothetical protein [Sinorhizobium meliloti]|nr:hypothetical protein [Sinorhizobium meliloti]